MLRSGFLLSSPPLLGPKSPVFSSSRENTVRSALMRQSPTTPPSTLAMNSQRTVQLPQPCVRAGIKARMREGKGEGCCVGHLHITSLVPANSFRLSPGKINSLVNLHCCLLCSYTKIASSARANEGSKPRGAAGCRLWGKSQPGSKTAPQHPSSEDGFEWPS